LLKYFISASQANSVFYLSGTGNKYIVVDADHRSRWTQILVVWHLSEGVTDSESGELTE